MNIHLKGTWTTRQVWLNGKKLSPKKSQKISNHSPDGFSWGYSGSGPAQLALAICLELYGSHEGYQDFKFKYIATLPQDDIDIDIEIEQRVTEQEFNRESFASLKAFNTSLKKFLNYKA